MSISRSSTNVSNSATSGFPVSATHTLVSGSDRLIVVSVGIEIFNGVFAPTATYGGVSMVGPIGEAVTPAKDTNNFTNGSYFFYLAEASLPSDGSNTVTVTASNGLSDPNCKIAFVCAQYAGVDASTVSAASASVSTSATTLSNTVSASDGELILSVASFGQGGSGSYTHDESQNEILDIEVDSTAVFSATDLIASGSVTSVGSTISSGSSVNRHTRSAMTFEPSASPPQEYEIGGAGAATVQGGPASYQNDYSFSLPGGSVSLQGGPMAYENEQNFEISGGSISAQGGPVSYQNDQAFEIPGGSVASQGGAVSFENDQAYLFDGGSVSVQGGSVSFENISQYSIAGASVSSQGGAVAYENDQIFEIGGATASSQGGALGYQNDLAFEIGGGSVTSQGGPVEVDVNSGEFSIVGGSVTIQGGPVAFEGGESNFKGGAPPVRKRIIINIGSDPVNEPLPDLEVINGPSVYEEVKRPRSKTAPSKKRKAKASPVVRPDSADIGASELPQPNNETEQNARSSEVEAAIQAVTQGVTASDAYLLSRQIALKALQERERRAEDDGDLELAALAMLLMD